MNFAYMTLKAVLEDYNQFKKSNLQPAIMKVMNCSYEKAFDLGKTHCNMISTWAIIFALEAYNKSYEAFFRDCRKKGICSPEGFFYYDKPEFFPKLGIECKITKYDSIPPDLSAGQVFQIAINNKAHFMAGASADDGNIYLFDTNDRPFGEELIKALMVKSDKITWIKKYEGVA